MEILTFFKFQMDIDKQLRLGHLLLVDRKCKSCGEVKNLIDGFYRTHKERGPVSSSYAYECKECAIKRVTEMKKRKSYLKSVWEYPDW